MACALVCAVLTIVLYMYLKRQNTIRENLTPEERQQWIDEGRDGDAHPDYKFIL
jgi:hypothetical protein